MEKKQISSVQAYSKMSFNLIKLFQTCQLKPNPISLLPSAGTSLQKKHLSEFTLCTDASFTLQSEGHLFPPEGNAPSLFPEWNLSAVPECFWILSLHNNKLIILQTKLPSSELLHSDCMLGRFEVKWFFPFFVVAWPRFKFTSQLVIFHLNGSISIA